MTKLEITRSTQFKKDLKKILKQKKDISALGKVIERLQAKKPLPHKNRDHNLVGE